MTNFTFWFLSFLSGAKRSVVYMDVLEGKSADETICPWREKALLSRLRSRLAAIGIENVHQYWHSFRRGAAFLASKTGVADCVIKKTWQMGKSSLSEVRSSRGCSRRKGNPHRSDRINKEKVSFNKISLVGWPISAIV